MEIPNIAEKASKLINIGKIQKMSRKKQNHFDNTEFKLFQMNNMYK